jgi:hypothetical protein
VCEGSDGWEADILTYHKKSGVDVAGKNRRTDGARYAAARIMMDWLLKLGGIGFSALVPQGGEKKIPAIG